MIKNGFTLIELLAVIVILAIIALIATPIILNIIKSTKDNAVVRSGELYLDALEQEIARKNLKESFNPSSCVIRKDGNLMCDGEIFVIETNGSRPINGKIKLDNGKIIIVDKMILDGYELNLNNNKLELGESVSILDPKGSYLKSEVGTATTVLGGTLNKSTVESIVITNTKLVPSGVIGSWDVSQAQDKSVMAWYTDKDNNNLYELYIGGEDGVKANPNSSYLFKGFTNVKTMNLEYLDTSEVTDMSYMFSGSSNLTDLNISNFDTSKVTNMYGMFSSCSKLESIDLTHFDTSSVTSMRSLFSTCTNLKEVDLSNFKTSNVETMEGFFYNCKNLTSIKGLNIFDTGKVTTMQSMFMECNSLTELDLSNFNTENVKVMATMFYNCNKLLNLKLSSFNTSNVTTMSSMFQSCSELKKLDLSNFNTPSLEISMGMFLSCKNLVTIDLRNLDISNIDSTKDYSMFRDLLKLKTIIVKDLNVKTWIENKLSTDNITGVDVVTIN